jgi:hypothetical protein
MIVVPPRALFAHLDAIVVAIRGISKADARQVPVTAGRAAQRLITDAA